MRRGATVLVLGVIASGSLAAGARAQDSLPAGVRVGITYAPGARPGMTVVPLTAAVAAESVTTIVARDLDESDRFEMIGAPDTLARSGTPDLRVLGALGSAWVVSVSAQGPRVTLLLTDVRTGALHLRRDVTVGADAIPNRFEAHRAADDIVRAATATPGIAATEILFVDNGKIWRVDADGAAPTRLRTAGWPALSPAWSPDGRHMVYTAYVTDGQPLVLQDLASGERTVVPGTEYGLNITPEFSRDGRRIAFAHGTESGTDIYVYQLGAAAWQRLTVGRFADNLSPTWSPDGTRIAFISTRARTPQLYVMSADGTDPELLGRFDYGATGQTQAPAWSPDGQFIAFHRDVNGVPQLFILDADTRAVRQLTGAGRNEDPSWAPDGRHLVFTSDRSGARELWVLDIETGRVRQLTHLGGARLPAWSPALGGSTP